MTVRYHKKHSLFFTLLFIFLFQNTFFFSFSLSISSVFSLLLEVQTVLRSIERVISLHSL
ncbi:hypothetical protein I7I48_10557 [Histoplasma ohiense]|nr:hypothetical protein I7I48_10557 [Histoplasma ohiense (nom. inval.)]